eukprot:1133891-Lingulodinium_polyedra.AAC.1
MPTPTLATLPSATPPTWIWINNTYDCEITGMRKHNPSAASWTYGWGAPSAGRHATEGPARRSA